MSLATPESVQKLQTALHAKAKESPNFRFYALYDKVYREDVLAFAYALLESQRRSSGSGRTDVRGHRGVWRERWLDELAQELKKPNVSTASGAAGVYTQAGREAAAAGNSHDPRPSRADGGGAGLGADLRGRSAAGAIRLSARTAARWTP